MEEKGLVAVYRSGDNSWYIMFDGEELFRYTIDFIPRDYVVSVAVKKGKLPPSALIDSEVADESADQVLEWFEEEYFPSREFGEDLLKSFIKFLKDMKDSGKINDILTIPQQSDSGEDVADLTL